MAREKRSGGSISENGLLPIRLSAFADPNIPWHVTNGTVPRQAEARPQTTVCSTYGGSLGRHVPRTISRPPPTLPAALHGDHQIRLPPQRHGYASRPSSGGCCGPASTRHAARRVASGHLWRGQASWLWMATRQHTASRSPRRPGSVTSRIRREASSLCQYGVTESPPP